MLSVHLPSRKQLGSQAETMWLIHVEDMDGGPTDGRETYDLCSAKTKVLVPILLAWIKERYDVACLAVNSRQVR